MTMAKIARIPITNVYMDGDYTASIRVGPHQTPMNVIVDTGAAHWRLTVLNTARNPAPVTRRQGLLKPTGTATEVSVGQALSSRRPFQSEIWHLT